MCHNFQILMPGSWQRPTHSAELQGPWSHWCDSFSSHNILPTILPSGPVGIFQHQNWPHIITAASKI